MKRLVKKWMSVLLAGTMLLCMTAGLTGCEGGGGVEDPLTVTYRNFVQQNFSHDYIAFKADVTHDGVDDLIVIDKSHEEDPDYITYGHIYTCYYGTVVRLATKSNATVHSGGGQFSWVIRPVGNGYYNLISEDGTLYQGSGDIVLHEYYIDVDTQDIRLVKEYDRVKTKTPVSDARWEQYLSIGNRALQGTYSLYIYQSGWDFNEPPLAASLVIARG